MIPIAQKKPSPTGDGFFDGSGNRVRHTEKHCPAQALRQPH